MRDKDGGAHRAGRRRGAADWPAIGLVVYVAGCFAMVSVSTKIAYEGGSDALSAMILRSVLALALLVGYLVWRKVPVKLPPHQRYWALGLGMVFCGNNFGMFAALETLPAPLAVLIFYMSPIMVALVEWTIGNKHGGRKITALSIAALPIAFGGLALALNAGKYPINPVGVAWATFAAVCFTVVLVLSGRMFPPGDSRPRTVHMLGAASVFILSISAVYGEFVWPNTGRAWIGILGCTLFFTLAVTGMFAAVARVGAARTTRILNMEPVLVVVASYLVLNDAIAPMQGVGIGLVVAAVWALERNTTGADAVAIATVRD